MIEQVKDKSVNVTLVGGYRVSQSPDGFRLEPLNTLDDYPNVDALVLTSSANAIDIAKLLSQAFQKGYSEGESSFRIGDIGYAEVKGGDDAYCKLYELGVSGEKEQEPILVSKSIEELVTGLVLLLERKDGY